MGGSSSGLWYRERMCTCNNLSVLEENNCKHLRPELKNFVYRNIYLFAPKLPR